MAVARQMLAGVMLAMGACAFNVSAQSMPVVQEFYFDNDPAATPMVAVTGSAADLVDQLMKQRERGRKTLEATVQLAGVAIAQGRPELGRSLYEQATSTTAASALQARSVHWNYGWDLFRLGETEAALVQWTTAQNGMRGNPSWVPPTYALALWTLGRKSDAVQWYAAAVRTEPQQWSGTDRYAALLPGWRDSERSTLAEIQQAWAEKPPAWP
ncbi:MAG: tetratricopeptide repeat protein [Stenotrophomonas maltophilia]